MANTPRMQALRKAFPNKTIYELMDLDLKSLGLEGLRNIPLNQVKVENNSAIAKRLLNPPPGKVLTGPAIKLAYEPFTTNGNTSPSSFSPVKFSSSHWKDQSGEPGFDANHSGGDMNVAILPGIIKELKYSYNPNRVGGDGRRGAGYGHYVIVEHVDPNNGQRFEALYAHFPKSDWQKLKVGQRLQQFEPFGRMGWQKEDGGTEERVEIGSTRGYHSSIDFYNVGSYEAYPHRQGIIDYVRNLGRGN